MPKNIIIQDKQYEQILRTEYLQTLNEQVDGEIHEQQL